MSLSDAGRRLRIFADAPGDYIGPLREAYAGLADTYEGAAEALKADIRLLLAEHEEFEHGHSDDHG